MAESGLDRELLLNRLADEFAARYRGGERPALQEYVEKYPELADDIRELFPAMVEMEQVKEDHREVEPHAASRLPPLEQLGDFRILREIGHGGMGVVYEAEQVSLGRHAALKVLPQKVLLDTRGTVWLTDFGLAKAEDQENLTPSGDLLGTLRYMAPEAFDGKSDLRSDVYGLGVTLYELLALRPAFDERERHRLIKRVTTSEPAALDRLNRSIPRDLVTVVHKAIERDPDQRVVTTSGDQTLRLWDTLPPAARAQPRPVPDN